MSEFDPDIKTHTKIVEELEEVLGKDGNIRVDTPTLADKIAEQTDTGLQRDTIYSIINSGSDWIADNRSIVVERERGGSGGDETKYWRLDS